jgi:hypothetical protein
MLIGIVLKIVQVTQDVPDNARVLGRGAGGSVCEVVNLWKSSWGPSKGVNDLDWGVAG